MKRTPSLLPLPSKVLPSFVRGCGAEALTQRCVVPGRDYRAAFRVLLSPRIYQAAKSAQPDTLREIDGRDGFDHRVGHLWLRSMTAESSNAPFLKRLGAFASHRGSWGGLRHDQGLRD